MDEWQTFELPRPISTNALYFNRRGGGRAKTREYVTWLRAAGWMIRAKKPKARQLRVPCEAEITLPDDWRGDTDNIKCVLDGLQACGVIMNDRLIRKLTIIRAPIKGSRAAVRPLDKSDEASPSGKLTADGFEAATDGKGASPAARTPGDF